MDPPKRILYLSRSPGSNGIHKATADAASALDIETQLVDDLEQPLPGWLMCTPAVVDISEGQVVVYLADAALQVVRSAALNALSPAAPTSAGAGAVDRLSGAELSVGKG